MASDPALLILYQVGLLVIVASLVAGLFKRLNLPGLIGAILVGFFIGGPGGLGFITDLTIIDTLAVLGVVLMLFVTGLEFDVSTFRTAGKNAILLTSVGVAFSVLCGLLIGLALGWSVGVSFLLGVALAPSGTSVVASILSSERVTGTHGGSVLLTACVVDDVEGIILLTIALGFLTSLSPSIPSLLQVSFLSILFIVGSIWIGGKLLPRVIDRAEKTLSQDTLFAVLIGLGLLFAFAATLVGLAAITGAFIIGAIIPYKTIGRQLQQRVTMMKDLFAVIFFTSIGLSINPFDFPAVLPLAVLVLLAALVARLGGGILGGYAGGMRGKALATLALGLSIRAEISLIIAREAVTAGLAGTDFLALTTAVVIGSIIVAVPLFSRMIRGINEQSEANRTEHSDEHGDET